MGISSAQQVHKIDLFNPQNFLRRNLAEQLIKSATMEKVGATGEVTWTQCDDKSKVFTFDESSTTIDPSRMTKGTSCSINMAGVVSSPIHIKNVHVHVDWNSAPLYDEDHTQDNTYDSDYSYQISWDVPSFAPDGHYSVFLTGIGTGGQA